MNAPPLPRSPRRQALPLAATALLLALAAAYLLVFTGPAALAEERAFKAAAACPANAPSAECARTVPARVDRAETERRYKTAYYWLSLTEPGGPSHRLKMNDGSGVFGAVTAGDRVTVTHWRGEIRSVGFRGLRQYTDSVPMGSYRLPYAVALALLAAGASVLWAAYWVARRSADSPARYPWQITVPTFAAVWLACIGFAAPWVTDGVPGALLLTAAGSLPILAGAVWRIRGHRRRTTDTYDVTARVPDTEECFPGAILGDVPYSVAGFDNLVAGPGLLAATPDPTGRIARRTAPTTLRPLRVRPPYRSDPGPAAPNGCHVVECLDGETPVFIVTAPENTPWVLGALRGAGPSRSAAPPRGHDRPTERPADS